MQDLWQKKGGEFDDLRGELQAAPKPTQKVGYSSNPEGGVEAGSEAIGCLVGAKSEGEFQVVKNARFWVTPKGVLY